MTKLTKEQAVTIFKMHYLPAIRHAEKQCSNRKDVGLRSQEWGIFTDSLCKDGQITENQYNTWSTPSCCK